MANYSSELRKRVVDAYTQGLSGTYEQTMKLFQVSRPTLTRWLKSYREEGRTENLPRGGNNPIKLDEAWLLEHATKFPNARCIDRAAAYEKERGIHVHPETVRYALRRMGWSFKKKRWLPKSEKKSA